MSRFLAALAALALAGCSHMSTQTRALEVAHGLLMAADASQTIQGQHGGCYREADTITRRFIGDHPSSPQIVGWTAVHFTINAAVANWLDRQVEVSDDEGWSYARWAWHVFNFAYEIKTVAGNRREGLSIFSPRSTPQRCIDARREAGLP